MPKLDLESSNEFWKNFDDPTLYRVIAFMETAEEWTLDGNPELETVITKLGEAFDTLNSFEVGKEDEFIGLTAHLKTSRILRFLQTIDTIDPGSASKILMYAEENNNSDNPMATFFLRRNIVFERLRLLSRAFSPERIALMMKVLEHEE
jgi:intracellular multiplication protein IcmW